MWTGPENEVLVWTFNLDAIDSAAVAPVLSIDERERAARFRFDIHRERYIAGRGTMRVALGAVAGVDPEELEFAYGAHGKPELKSQNAGALHFNLSHSDDRAILGVTRAGPVGVDVERINATRGNRDVARRFFSPREISDLDGLTGEAYTRGFFHCWARKEAVLKAVGTGITGGLSSFSVPIGEMPDPVHVEAPDCWIGNLSGAFPYLEAEGFSSSVALLEKIPLVRAVCDTVLRIPVRRTFK
jgi:4'-phosphopantetheinyl transferase